MAHVFLTGWCGPIQQTSHRFRRSTDLAADGLDRRAVSARRVAAATCAPGLVDGTFELAVIVFNIVVFVRDAKVVVHRSGGASPRVTALH